MHDKILIHFSANVLLIMILMNDISTEYLRKFSICDNDLPKEKADGFAKCDSQLPQIVKG